MLATSARGWSSCSSTLRPQHWTGIDWTHGFSARLAEHRYAYGVYRVSGFMGHPLTFAYNMLLLLLAALALACPWRLGGKAWGDQKWWLGAAAACFLMLLISGSRYVLIVAVAVLLLAERRRLWRFRYWLLLGLALSAVVLWAEGSVLGRFGELFAPGCRYSSASRV